MPMKAKVSLNSEAIKKFFIAHGEKVAFALLLAAAGWVGYTASQIPVYGEGGTAGGGFGPGKPKTAQDLADEVNLARQNISSSDKRMNLPEDGIAQPKVTFGEIVDKLVAASINPAAFGGHQWNRPIRENRSRRKEPVYLAARDLRASFHRGAIQVANGDQKGVEGDEWICVTALVPNELQIAEYRRAFENAGDARANAIPRYFVYRLRRAEVDPNPSAAEKPIDWEKDAQVIDLSQSIDAVMARWDGNTRERAEPKFTQWPYLTQPLMPVADSATIDESVAHVPEIPIFQPEAAAPGAAPAAAPPPPASGVFAKADPAAAAAAAAVPVQEPAAGAPQPPANYLFRFFDFNIEPGKAYRYQIQLVLFNPNKGLNPAFLENPALGEGDYRDAPWSKESPAAAFPYLEHYFAGDLEPANGDSEAQSNVAIRKWSPRFGADVFHEYVKRLRGAVLNTTGADVYYRVPGKPEAASAKEDMTSNLMVVDFSWERLQGRQLTAEGRPINRPSELLLLSPRGELMIRTQLMHWPQWAEFQTLVAGGPAAGTGPGPGTGPIPTPPSDSRPGPFNLR
jgi:hypothetical protein